VFKKGQTSLLQLAVVAGMSSVGMIAPAQATPYPFTFQGTGVTASGVFMTGGLDSTLPGFDITEITDGTYDGFDITKLVDPVACAASVICNTLDPLPDNVLYIPGSPSFLDLGGVVFSANGDLVNLFFDGTNYFVADCGTSCTTFDEASFFEGTLEVTPLPGSLPLLATILVPGYFISAWRRRRKYRSAIVPV
jgi:hypothetical protein